MFPSLKIDNETEKRSAFAMALAQTPNDAFGAALRVFGDDTGTALSVYAVWAKDPEIIAEANKQRDLIDPAARMPHREAIALEVLEIGRSEKHKVEDRLKAYKLYGEMMGIIEKPNTTINNQVNVSNRVMLVPVSSSDEEWERRLYKQQTALVNAAAE